MTPNTQLTPWSRAMARRVALTLTALVAIGSSTFTIAVKPAHADIFMPGAADQIKLGEQAGAEIEQKYPVLHDARAAHLQQVGERLLNALSPKDRGPWHWTFHLLDSKEINAFALPGGNVYFYTGLYDKLHDDDALAAVLGHEFTHVRQQHWARQYASEQKRQLGLALILGLAHANNTWQSVAGLGEGLLHLRYSRGDEEQADLMGLQNMQAANYNPCGMIELFHILQSTGGGGGPEFLSDHPLTSHRIKAAQDTIRRMNGSYCQ